MSEQRPYYDPRVEERLDLVEPAETAAPADNSPTGVAADRSVQAPIPDVPSLDKYEILEKIGQGGMGVVYRARHKELNKHFAIKMLHPEHSKDPINIKRFQQEARSASMLEHPNLISIYDSGIAPDGAPYLVMDFVKGQSLEGLLNKEGFIELDRFFAIMAQVCEALQHAHSAGVIHRDIKPSNIMITGDDHEIVKLVDFGIARVMQPTTKSMTKLTQSNDVLGSPVYMSPEQCLGYQLDERSDIYSLGVVMYECLAGTPPFAADNAIQVIVKQLQQDARPINRLRPDAGVPPALEQIVMQCLDKDPDSRFQSVGELNMALDAAQYDPKKARAGLLKQWRRTLRNYIKRRASSLPSVGSIALVMTSIIFFSAAFLLPHTMAPDSRNIPVVVEPAQPPPEPFKLPADLESSKDWKDFLLAGSEANNAGDGNKAIAIWKAALERSDKLHIPPADQAMLNTKIADAYWAFNRGGTGQEFPFETYGKFAEERYQYALATYDKLHTPPESHIQLYEHLADAQSDQNHFSDAYATLNRVIGMLRVHGNSEHLVEVYTDAARVLCSMDRNDEANKLYREALMVEKRTHGAQMSDEGYTAYFEMASNLEQMGKYKEALSVIDEQLPRMRNRWGQNNDYYIASLDQKVRISDHLGLKDDIVATNKLIQTIKEKMKNPSASGAIGSSPAPQR